MSSRKVILFLVFLGLVLIALLGFNIYLTSRASDPVRFERTVKEIVKKELTPIVNEPGPMGLTGAQGISGLSIVGPKGDAGSSGKDGQDGQNGLDGKDGEKGEPGIPGREVELSEDELGNILWRYTGDDFWTVLVEGCKLTNTCEE